MNVNGVVGTEHAQQAVEDWMKELESVDGPPEEAIPA